MKYILPKDDSALIPFVVRLEKKIEALAIGNITDRPILSVEELTSYEEKTLKYGFKNDYRLYREHVISRIKAYNLMKKYIEGKPKTPE